MNMLLTIVLVGISLSMDAFSLSIAYGTYSLKKTSMILLSSIVGIFHFFMPLLGVVFGQFINDFLIVNIDLVVGIIFGFIGIEMIFSSIKNEEVNIIVSFVGFLLFGLSVSIDSFTTGIGLSLINDNYFLCSFIFMIISFLFTFVGLNFGSRLNDKLGIYSTFCGGIILVLLSICYMF